MDILKILTEKSISLLSGKSGDHLTNSDNFVYKDYLIKEFNGEALFEPFPLSNVQKTYYLGRFNSFELSNISAHFYSEHHYAILDREKLERTWNVLINRHLTLRTVCVNYQQQFVKTPSYYKIEMHELSSELELVNIRNQLSHKVYTPDVYPMFDIRISKLNTNFILHISFDAILLDTISLQILFQEWVQLYRDENLMLLDLDISYRDYAVQYEKIRNSELFKKAETYWHKKIDDYNFEMNLPLKMHPSEITYPKFARITKTIKKEIWMRLLEKTKQANVSQTALILEIYGRVLSYWTGQNVLSINLTLFNRLPLHTQINKILGDFTVLELFNYRIFEGSFEKYTISEKLHDIQEVLNKNSKHHLFDGIDLQRLIREKRSIPANQILSQVVLTSLLGNEHKENLFELPLEETYAGVQYAISQTSQVWLNNKAYETTAGFVAEWDYVEQLFDKEIMEAMHDSYCFLIESLSQINWETEEFPKLVISDLGQQLINDANNSEQALSQDTLFSRYENTVLKKSLQDHIAVIDAETDKNYTHGQLMQDSNLLAKYLVQTLDQGSQLIGVLSEKGYNQVVGTLSIMKSGVGYLPLHVDWPLGRVDEILEQGGVKTLLLSKKQYARENISAFLSHQYTLIVIEEVLEILGNEHQTELEKVKLPKVDIEEVAYVIFTSGSTGKPKGVTISHKAALNTIEAVNKRFSVTEKDSLFALSELSFDLSVYDIFGMLAVGGRIIFPLQNKTKDPSHWVSIIQRYGVTLWNTVPQLAGLLIEELKGSKKTLESIRVFLLSGDWIPTTLPSQIKQYCSNAVVMSLGGATEGSIWSVWYEVNSVPENWNKIPYGVAMPNQKISVLNHENEHCPIGVIGEIHIGGMGVALNYWGNPTLTNARFIEHPQLGRLYKTGDLGRWHKEGYMEFIGRNDFQVKINGYRVELEEIAAKLAKLEGIVDAVVRIQKQDNLAYLVAYLLPDNSKKIESEQSINQRLSESLPDYMLPSIYVMLDELPLSANGKLDINKLPKPQFSRTYIPPENEEEVKLIEIWSGILGVSSHKIGIHDNFFAIGGNSLMAVQLVVRIKNQLGVKLELMDLKNITVHEIAKRLKSQALNQNSVNTPESNIIRIKQGTSKEQLPFILIHPTGGDIYFYHGFASALPEEQTVYAIRSPMLEGRAPFQSIEEMASSYLAALREANIKPPYVLGGSSFGGIVAYHMAQILHANTLYTPMLVLVDTPAYGNMPRALTDQEVLEYLIKYGLGHLPISLEELRLRKGIEEQIQYMADIAATTELKDMISTEFLPIFIHTWQTNTDALLKYVPNVYTGPIVFFSHTETIEEFPTNQHIHWVNYARGKFKNFIAPGNHISMNAPPNIEVIAKHVFDAIQEESLQVTFQQEKAEALLAVE